MKDFQVRPYQPKDEEKIVPLLDTVFKGWPHLDLQCSNIDFWKWKYHANPIASSNIVVAETGDEIVGACHQYPVNIIFNQKTHVASFASDMTVHPDYRGKGMARQMNLLLKEKRRDKKNIHFYYFATRHPHMINMHQKMDHELPYKIVNHVKIDDIDKHLNAIPTDQNLIMKLGYTTIQLKNKLIQQFQSTPRKDESIIVEKIDKFGIDIDQLWNRNIVNYDFIVERNYQYLNWRYNDPRAGDFTIYQAREKDTILGYIILRINRYNPKYPLGYIVDLFCDVNRPQVQAELIAEGVKYFEENKVNTQICSLISNQTTNNILQHNGFVDSRTKFLVFYNSDYPSGSLELTANGDKLVHFSFGDTDSLPSGIQHH